MSSLVTAALTALFGILVFVVGQFAQRFFLEPIQEQRRVIGEIAYALVFYANVSDVSENRRLGRPLLELEDPTVVAKSLRRLASQLRSSLYTVPFYELFSRLKAVPNKEAVLKASQGLVGWSNSIHSGDPYVHRKSVAEQLKLPE
jgi:hypothetical protein